MTEQNIYKKAAMKKLLIKTPVGNVTADDLFDLSLEQLDTAACQYKTKIEAQSRESLFADKTVNPNYQLAYDLIVDVFHTLRDRAAVAAKRLATSQRNKRIRELMAQKQDAELADKSLEELESLLADPDAE